MIVDALEIDLVRTNKRAVAGEAGDGAVEARRCVEGQAAGRALEGDRFRGRNRAADLQRSAAGDRRRRCGWRVDDIDAAMPVARHHPAGARQISSQRENFGMLVRRVGHRQRRGVERTVVAAAAGCRHRRRRGEAMDIQDIAGAYDAGNFSAEGRGLGQIERAVARDERDGIPRGRADGVGRAVGDLVGRRDDNADILGRGFGNASSVVAKVVGSDGERVGAGVIRDRVVDDAVRERRIDRCLRTEQLDRAGSGARHGSKTAGVLELHRAMVDRERDFDLHRTGGSIGDGKAADPGRGVLDGRHRRAADVIGQQDGLVLAGAAAGYPGNIEMLAIGRDRGQGVVGGRIIGRGRDHAAAGRIDLHQHAFGSAVTGGRADHEQPAIDFYCAVQRVGAGGAEGVAKGHRTVGIVSGDEVVLLSIADVGIAHRVKLAADGDDAVERPGDAEAVLVNGNRAEVVAEAPHRRIVKRFVAVLGAAHGPDMPLPIGGGVGGRATRHAADWQGHIWAVGSSEHGNETFNNPTVWSFSYDLGTVAIHEDSLGVAGAFNGVVTIGSELYAVGYADVSDGQQDYLIAGYNTDGSVAFSHTFGPAGTDTLNGAVEVDGRLFVVGSTTSDGATEGVLMEIDPASGSVISTTTYDPAPYNALTSITTDGQHLYIAGVSGSSASQDQAVLLTYDVGGATMTAVEDTAARIGSLAVSDASTGSVQIEVTLAVDHGSVQLENTSGLASVTGAGTGSVELFGSQAAINAALADGVIYNPVSNYTGADTLTITANDLGHNGTGVAESSTQDVGIVVTAADQIADGATYTVSAPSGDTIAFVTGNGTLDLAQPATFSGEIAGIVGTGDILDIHGFAAATTMATTGSGSYDSTLNTTTLTVTDSSDQHTEILTLAGNLSGSGWVVTGDGHGGVDVVDPPAAPSSAIAGGGSLEIGSAVASTETITFQGSTGSLALDTPSSFHGTIAGFTGDGTLVGSDQIDLKGVDYHSGSFAESFSAATDTLSVSDGTEVAALHFIGSYVAANFSFATDGNGGTIVYDPPVPAGAQPSAAVASGHGVTFNFANTGHGTSTDWHPANDAQHATAANALAAWSATHDPAAGSPAAPDAHDAMTTTAI